MYRGFGSVVCRRGIEIQSLYNDRTQRMGGKAEARIKRSRAGDEKNVNPRSLLHPGFMYGKRDSIHHHLLEVTFETANVLELKPKLLHAAPSWWWWCNSLYIYIYIYTYIRIIIIIIIVYIIAY